MGNVAVQCTFAAHGHILTHAGVWSPDSQRLVYDVRSDSAGSTFDGDRIETVDIRTFHIQTLYTARNGAHCGVAAYSPIREEVAFILGPEHPDAAYSYGISRRRGMLVAEANPEEAIGLDARDISRKTPGAHSGGTHVHQFHPHGDRLTCTYDDDVTPNGRTIVVLGPSGPVSVIKSHPRDHDGALAACIVVPLAEAGLTRACEESWLGCRDALAFQGTPIGQAPEVYIVDTAIRRLTFTQDRPHPGIAGPRHWLRSSPDGQQIGVLIGDDLGVPQFHVVSPVDGRCRQVTHGAEPIASAFTWSPAGDAVCLVRGGTVCRVEVATGTVTMLAELPNIRSEACVWSPDGRRVAFVCEVDGWNQLFTVEV